MKPNTFLLPLLACLLWMISCSDDDTVTRQQALNESTQQYYNAVKNIIWHQENMNNAQKKAEEQEQAIMYLSKCLSNAPQENHSLIQKISNAISSLEEELGQTWNDYRKHAYQVQNAKFSIANYGEGSCFIESIDSVSVEIVDELK